MIVHAIQVHRVPVSKKQQAKASKKFQGESGSVDHKKFIFMRALGGNPFKVGQSVLHKRNPVQVVEIITEYGPAIEWDGLCPRFIEVAGGNSTYLVHPSQLRRKR